MAYVSPSTQVTGTLITSTMYAQLVNDLKFFHGVPTVRVNRATVQTISNNTFTAIAFSSKEWDTNGMFATTGTKVTCKTAGKFLVNFQSGFVASTAGTLRAVGIRKNSTGTGEPGEWNQWARKTDASIPLVNVSGLVSLTTGQFIEGVVYQDTGGTLNTSTVGGRRARLSMLWLSS